MSDVMRRILLAYDGTASAQRALVVAANLAQQFGAAVGVVNVELPRPPLAARSHHEELRRLEELEDARRRLADFGLEAELIEPIGDPAPTIERLAAIGGFDTIVVGSRRLGRIARVLRGSVSEHVVTHADATVLVVR